MCSREQDISRGEKAENTTLILRGGPISRVENDPHLKKKKKLFLGKRVRSNGRIGVRVMVILVMWVSNLAIYTKHILNNIKA